MLLNKECSKFLIWSFILSFLHYFQKFKKESVSFKLKNLEKLYEKRKQGLRDEKRNFQDQKYMVYLLKKNTIDLKMDEIKKKLSGLQVSLNMSFIEDNSFIKY